jgi:hypothetical protein
MRGRDLGEGDSCQRLLRGSSASHRGAVKPDLLTTPTRVPTLTLPPSSPHPNVLPRFQNPHRTSSPPALPRSAISFGRLSAACNRVTNVEFDDRRLFLGRGSAESALGGIDEALLHGFFFPVEAWGIAASGTSIGGGGSLEDGGESESEDTEGS